MTELYLTYFSDFSLVVVVVSNYYCYYYYCYYYGTTILEEEKKKKKKNSSSTTILFKVSKEGRKAKTGSSVRGYHLSQTSLETHPPRWEVTPYPAW